VIAAAGLLVLVGLGMFVAGLATGSTAFFWGCVAVCVVAAVLLVLARRSMTARPGERRETAEALPAAAVVAAASAPARSTPSAPATASMPPAVATASMPSAADASAAAAGDVPPATPPAEMPPASAPPEDGEPPVEEVEVTDLLLVVDLTDEVLVVDEHPRYHLPGCRWLAGRETIPLPLDEARTDGFTPCGACAPDRNLAERERARKGTSDH
jgi:hypothetical protein